VRTINYLYEPIGWSGETNDQPPEISGEHLKHVEDGIMGTLEEVGYMLDILEEQKTTIINMQGDSNTHLEDKDNPHGVTIEQLGLNPANLEPREMTSDLHNWLNGAEQGVYIGDGTDIINGLSDFWHYIGIVGSQNRITILAMSHTQSGSLQIKYRVNGTWAAWVQTGRTITVSNAVPSGGKDGDVHIQWFT